MNQTATQWTRCRLISSGMPMSLPIDPAGLTDALGGVDVEAVAALDDIGAIQSLEVGVVPCVVLNGAVDRRVHRAWTPTQPDAAAWAALAAPIAADTGGRPARGAAGSVTAGKGFGAADDVYTLTHCLAHDLRGPIRNGARLIDIVLRSAVLEPDARALLERVRGGSERLAEYVDDLVQFLRMAQANLSLSRVDASVLSTQLLAELAEAWPHANRVMRVQPDMLVWGDLQLVAMALRQLLDNACKFSLYTAAPEIHVELLEAGPFDVLVVSDNGAGFSAAHSQALFQPFERIHLQSEFPGNGMGLALVRRVAERHGGWAWADLGSPGWTRFLLAFPAPQRQAEPGAITWRRQ